MEDEIAVRTRLRTILTLVVFGGTSFAQADTLPKYNDLAIKEINNLSEIGRCQDAWELFLSYVERGSGRAAYDLAISIGWGAISPPVDTADPNLTDFSASFVSSILSFTIDLETAKDAEINELRMEVFRLTWQQANFEKAVALGCFKDFSSSACQVLSKDEQSRRSIYRFLETFEENRQLGITAICN